VDLFIWNSGVLTLCIVFVDCIPSRPGWDDTPAYDLLLTSRFLRKLLVFEKSDHSYKEGLQHRVTAKVYRRSQARSFVFWMMTTAALEKWPITPDKLSEFKKAFMANR
jgi:hypothetical protein